MAEITRRGNIQDNINIKPWHKLSQQKETGTEYIVKYHFDKMRCSYEVIVYDGLVLRHERITGDEEFENKCKIYNPNIEANSSSLLEELQKCFEECLKSSTVSLQEENGNSPKLNLQIKAKLKAGIPFKWTFSLEEAPKDFVWKHVIQPLTIISNEMFRRQQQLCQLLQRKDREIQDYKDQGTSVSRRHLQTPFFDQSEYQRAANADQEFLDFCSQPVLTSLSGNLSDVYQKTMLNMESKIPPAEEPTNVGPGHSATFDTVPITGRVTQSWSNNKRLGDASFVQDQLDGGDDQVAQDQVAEVTVVTEAKSPEEEEKKRREELRKRLHQETDKKAKKKKRKLNI